METGSKAMTFAVTKHTATLLTWHDETCVLSGPTKNGNISILCVACNMPFSPFWDLFSSDTIIGG